MVTSWWISHWDIDSLVFPPRGVFPCPFPAARNLKNVSSTGNSAATTGTFEIPLFDDFWKPSKAAWLLDSTADDGESLSAGLLSLSRRTLRISGSCQSGHGHEPNISHILNGIIIQEQRLFFSRFRKKACQAPKTMLETPQLPQGLLSLLLGETTHHFQEIPSGIQLPPPTKHGRSDISTRKLAEANSDKIGFCTNVMQRNAWLLF